MHTHRDFDYLFMAQTDYSQSSELLCDVSLVLKATVLYIWSGFIYCNQVYLVFGSKTYNNTKTAFLFSIYSFILICLT